MRRQKIEELGFTSWLELYEYLKDANLHEHKEAALVWTDQQEEIISLEYVKAQAFQEIYPTLPQKGTIDVLRDLVEYLDERQQGRPLYEFFRKVTTRAND